MSDYHDPIPTYWNKSSVERVADVVADKLKFQVGDPVESIVHKLGGTITYGWEQLDEFEGGSIIARSVNDFRISLSDHTSARRDRFTLAHELGHLFLHLRLVLQKDDTAIMRATRHVRKGDDVQKRAEWEANWFAAQLLMPRLQFEQVCSEYGPEYAAEVFGVSEEAARVRKKSL